MGFLTKNPVELPSYGFRWPNTAQRAPRIVARICEARTLLGLLLQKLTASYRSSSNKLIQSKTSGITFLMVAACVCLSPGCQFQAARHTADGQWHVQNNQFGPAIDSYQQALMTNPRSADANYNLGTTYYYMAKQTGQAHFNPKSEDLLRQAISLNPNHVDAYRTLSALYIETQRPNDAFNLMRSWQVAQPTSPEPLVELARLYREHNDPTRAVQHLADALTIDPNNSRALVAMGSLREEQGQLELALKNYTRSYQANNYQPELATRIASLQQRLNSSTNSTNNTRYANPSMNNTLR